MPLKMWHCLEELAVSPLGYPEYQEVLRAPRFQCSQGPCVMVKPQPPRSPSWKFSAWPPFCSLDSRPRPIPGSGLTTGKPATSPALHQGQHGPHTTRAAPNLSQEEKGGKGSHALELGIVSNTLQHPFTSYNICDMDIIVPIF